MDHYVDNTGRFSGRAEAYTKYRSSYPPEAVAVSADYFKLPHGAKIADLGSGTGIVSALILETLQKQNVKVLGVEPNKDMRDAQEASLKSQIEDGTFESVNGSAEATNLPDHSIDLVFVAAAFHWFNPLAFRKECLRIIKSSGNAVDDASVQGAPIAIITRHHRPLSDIRDPKARKLAENMREMAGRSGATHTHEMHDIKFSPASMRTFFGHDEYKTQVYELTRKMDLQQIKGRMKSQSSMPEEGSERWDRLMVDVEECYEKFKDQDGTVELFNDLQLIYGYIR